MLALILYIVAALFFIAAVVLLSFIPNQAVKVIVLILFCLLFVVGTMYLMLKTSGQSDLESMFDALSPSGQTQWQMPSAENTAPPAPTQAAATPVPTQATVQQSPSPTPENTLQPTPTPMPDDTFSILRMWYDVDGSGYQLEFSPDGSVRYITPNEILAGMYTFDDTSGEGQIDIIGKVYGITYHFDTKTLGFDGLTYRCTPPGPVANPIVGFWYEQGEGLGQLEFFSDGTVIYYFDIDPEVGTYIFDTTLGHGDINLYGYTYELLYDADTDIINFEGALYSRIPW